MADSFFIRKTVNISNTNAFFEDSIDLGAYVDALSSSVLTIPRVDVAFTDNTGRSLRMAAADTASVAQFQLTTQSQADNVLLSDKSVIGDLLQVAIVRIEILVICIPFFCQDLQG